MKRDFEPIGMVAEIEIQYRSKVKSTDRVKITGAKDSYNVLKPYFENAGIEHHENMFVLVLNRNNKVLGCYKVSSGGTSGTTCDPKMVLQAALLANASGIILAHNHPSGNLTASQADINITNKIKLACEFMEIQLLDHIILTPDETYLSFANEGLI